MLLVSKDFNGNMSVNRALGELFSFKIFNIVSSTLLKSYYTKNPEFFNKISYLAMKRILKIIARIRRLLEPLTWKLFQPKNWESLPDLDKWEEVRELSLRAFSNRINSYEYKWDGIHGLLDNSHPIDKPQFFFKELKSGRDCDNWARIWVSYCIYHKIPVQEWIVTNKKHPFTKSHFVAVCKEGNKYRLLNYGASLYTYSTVEEALDDLNTWNSGDYAKDVRLQCLYAEYKV